MSTYQQLAKPTFLFVLMATLFTLLPGCASIVSGHQQPVAVQTGTAHADCSLSNARGTWHISRTPGSVIVSQSNDDMIVKCHKPGQHTIMQSVKSTTKPIVFGNVLLIGGAIAASYDMSTGAAYRYPSVVNVRVS